MRTPCPCPMLRRPRPRSRLAFPADPVWLNATESATAAPGRHGEWDPVVRAGAAVGSRIRGPGPARPGTRPRIATGGEGVRAGIARADRSARARIDESVADAGFSDEPGRSGI